MTLCMCVYVCVCVRANVIKWNGYIWCIEYWATMNPAK